MNLNLFGQNLVTLFAMMFAGALVYVAATPWLERPKPGKRRASFKRLQRKLVALVAGALGVALAFEIAAVMLFPNEQLPSIFFMALPLAFGIAAMLWTWPTRAKRYNRTIAGVAIFCGLLVGVLALNDYYHYYPTLGDAFSLNAHQQLGGGQTQTIVRFSKGKAAAPKTSLEASVQSLGPLPAQGQVFGISVPPTASHFATRKGWLYVPPVAFSPQKVNLPVIVLLAGAPGGPNDWLNGGGAEQTLNAFAAQHHGVAPLVAMVDDLGSQLNDTECVDSTHGNAETYLTTDVPNYLKANFDVSANPANWAIGGLSDGGMCGVMLTLRHPNTYHYFLDLGGPIGPGAGSKAAAVADFFNGSMDQWQAHQPTFLLQQDSFKNSGLGGFFAVGSSDSNDILSAVQTLYRQSAADGLDVASETTVGRHTFAVWQQQFHDALPWLSYRLGATECVSQCQ